MKNNVMITGAVVLVIVVGLIYVFAKGLPNNNQKTQKTKSDNLTTDNIYYAVILLPVESRDLTKEVIAQHGQHLRELDAEGKLVLAGPFTDNPSGLLVLRGKNKDEIKSIMEQDPLIQGGFRNFEVRTWLMANRANNYLP